MWMSVQSSQLPPKMSRPTFSYRQQPVRAAGILIWTCQNGKTLRLFNNCKGRFEDIGGKTDLVDSDALATAVREATEETNGKLFSANHSHEECQASLYQHIGTNSERVYNRKSKYLLYKVYVDPSLLSLEMTRFGRSENTDCGVLEHYFQWKHSVPQHLHPRLFGMRL